MDDIQKFDHWKDIAKYDLDTAEAMYQSGRCLYVVFMCQQAIEKLTKGLHVLKRGEEAPRTHNIYSILEKYLILTKRIQSLSKRKRICTWHTTSEQYPSYRKTIQFNKKG